MAGNQTDNVLIVDLVTGLPRTPETGGTPDVIQSSNDWEFISGANVTINGNLHVQGTTVTVDSETVNIADNHLYLNDGYTVAVGQTGGIVINYLPTGTVDTVAATGFVAGVAATSNPTVTTVGSATFAIGDLIQFSGANDQANDGLFEVKSHIGTALILQGVGLTGTTVDFVQNQFVTDTTVAGAITKVNVAILQVNGTGGWEVTNTSTTTGITFTEVTVQGIVDLQVAYEAGNTITTSGAEGNVTIAGTETMVVTTSGGIDLDTALDFDGTSFDVQMTGSNGFSIDGTAASNVSVTAGNLDLATLTSGDVNVSSAAALDLDATTTVTIDTADASDASANDIALTAGSSTAGTNAGASILLTTGDGNTSGDAGSVVISGPNDEDEAIVTLTTSGLGGDSIGFFVGDSDPSGSITADAGSLFFRDTGTGSELYLNTSTGSGTAWTALATAAGATLQSAYEAGNTITTSGAEGDVTFTGTEDFVVSVSDVLVDTTASISLDADAASNFTVAGGNLDLNTTTSGEVLIDGVGGVEINSSGGAIDLGNDATTGAINIGTGAAVRTITVGNATGATAVDFDSGTGGFSFDSTVPETSPILTLTTSGTSGDSADMFVGDSDPNGVITGQAGSLFLRDTGTGGELYVNTSTGSGTAWEQVVTTGAGGGLTLQTAYVGGNTIVTSGAEGAFDVSGTEAISLDASAASNFSVAGGNLNFATTTSGEILLDGVDGVEINSTSGAIDIGNDANANAINIGTGAAARTVTIGNATGITGVDFDSGTGGFSFDSTVPETTPILTLTTSGTSGDSADMFVGDSDPDGVITGQAGSLFLRDTATGGELYINNSTGSGTVWVEVATTDDVAAVTLQAAYVNGNTIVTSGAEGAFDVSGTEAISLDASAASNFSVASANLTLSTTTAGDVLVTSAGETLVDGAGGVEINSTGGAIDIGNDANANAINIGTGAAARTLTLGNATGATGMVVNVGTGEFALNSTVGEADPVATLSATGTGGNTAELFVGTSDPDASVTGLAGSLFLRDTGTTGELYVNTSTGSGTTWEQVVTTGAGGGLSLQTAYVGGNTIITSGAEGAFDVSGTEAISLDASAASNFTVDSATLTLSTTTSGTVDVTSAGSIDMTFAANAAAGMVIDDGTNNFFTFDSTTANLAIEANQFLDISGKGAGIEFTAGGPISIGDVVTFDTAGDVIRADSNTGTALDSYVIGIAATASTATNPVRVFTVTGSNVPTTFGSAPGAADNSKVVFLSTTGGEATLTPPTGGGNVIFKVGILQGGDGASTTPKVLFQPEFIARRP